MKQYTPEELNKLSKEEIVALLMQSQKEAALFKERLEELQMHLFGRSTERMECLGQESIFNEAEVKYNEEENEPEIEKAVVVRSKRPRGKLGEDLKGLPMRKEMHELSEDELQQIFGEKGWKRLPDEVSWKLDFKAFLEDGEVPIDNSASERSIRPFCVGRSNWHVIDSIKGAQASAIVYSIVETAKANNLKPYEYLQHLLSVMMEHIYDADTAYLDDLIPWSENLPDVCKKAP